MIEKIEIECYRQTNKKMKQNCGLDRRSKSALREIPPVFLTRVTYT
jgi:hypothetical protein